MGVLSLRQQIEAQEKAPNEVHDIGIIFKEYAEKVLAKKNT